MSESSNPFRIGVLAEGEHFVDREQEVARVRAALTEPAARLVLYGERRLGKSSVLNESVRQVRGGGDQAVLVSLATASSESDAAQRVLMALRAELGRTWRDLLDEVTSALDLGLELVPDPASGQPGVRLRFGRSPSPRASRVLPEILDVVHARMEAEDRVLGICLDEFQRIHEWGGEDAEWALREAIQRHVRIAYVFAGSKRSLIEAMVTEKGRALWKQADTMPFGPIDPKLLARWIWRRCRATDAELERAAAERIVELTHPRTRDVVQLARAAWPGPAGAAATHDVDEAFERLVNEQAALHERVWRGLGLSDQQVLRVFAAAPRPEDVSITSAETLARFDLGPKSTIANAVNRLVDRELLVSHRRAAYAFDDPYFQRWVQRNTLSDIGLPVPRLREIA